MLITVNPSSTALKNPPRIFPKHRFCGVLSSTRMSSFPEGLCPLAMPLRPLGPLFSCGKRSFSKINAYPFATSSCVHFFLYTISSIFQPNDPFKGKMSYYHSLPSCCFAAPLSRIWVARVAAHLLLTVHAATTASRHGRGYFSSSWSRFSLLDSSCAGSALESPVALPQLWRRFPTSGALRDKYDSLQEGNKHTPCLR